MLQATGRHSETHIRYYLQSHQKLQQLQADSTLSPEQRSEQMSEYITNHPDFIQLNETAREKKSALGNDPRAAEEAEQIYNALVAETISLADAEVKFRASGRHSEAQIKFFLDTYRRRQEIYAIPALSEKQRQTMLTEYVRQYLTTHQLY
jgi:hypothetical protein